MTKNGGRSKRAGDQHEDAGMRVFNGFLRLFERQESTDWSQQRGAVNVPKPILFYFFAFYNFRYNIFFPNGGFKRRSISTWDRSDVNNWIKQTNGINNNEKASTDSTLQELLTDQSTGICWICSPEGLYLFAHGRSIRSWVRYVPTEAACS